MRYAILRHEPGPASTRPLHWDLMLEQQDGLRTWALPREPSSGAAMTAAELPRHRRAYLEFEGPIAGGRGHVTRWDEGTYEVLDVDPSVAPAGGASRILQLRLRGRRLATTLRVIPCDSVSAECLAGDLQRWTLEFGK